MEQKFYVQYKDMAKIMIHNYQTYQKKTGFFQALDYLCRQQRVSPDIPGLYHEKQWEKLTDSEFEQILSELPISLNYFASLPAPDNKKDAVEAAMFPDNLDVYALRHLPFIDNALHAHDYFEVNYVFSGSCQQMAESESRRMTAGELCIIAPQTQHDILVTDESIILSLLIRQSTFDTAFFTLLTQDNLLSLFFRNILYQKESPSKYLLFSTGNEADIKNFFKSIFMECYLTDSYSNSCAVSRVHLLFAQVLRRYSGSIQFYSTHRSKDTHLDFPLILQYIQHNYQHLSLLELAEFFHYSPAYMSKLIKKMTGETFISLITRLRMSKAADYLKNPELKIEEAARLSGYDSADHFSRTFRKYFGCSPSRYRQG